MYAPFCFAALSKRAVACLMAFCTDKRVHFGECFCCDPRRTTYRFGGKREEWAHLDDDVYAELRHVHVESDSQDCDGHYEHGHIVTLTSVNPEALFPSYLHGMYRDEHRPDFHDLWNFTTAHVPPHLAYGDDYGPVQITIHASRVTWSRPTDEGGEWGEAYVCDDAWCDDAYRHYRDRTAERAGY